MRTLLELPWAVWVIVVPLAAAILTLLLGRRGGALRAALAPLVLLAVLGLTTQVWQRGVQRYPIGNWDAPLGIELLADGLSVLMLLMTGVVGVLVSIYATGYFAEEGPAEESFWPLWYFLWGALNALFLSADIFNLYVTLELVTLASVALVALAGTAEAVAAALRYLLAGILGSLAYLLGVALLYGVHGTLAVAALAQTMAPDTASALAITLMTLGLLLKTALFPFHFWLPAAHASAPGPVSALLSAVVVKGSFYLVLRLWLDAFAPALSFGAGQLLGLLGAAAILWGSVQALVAERLKLLIAYSTVAQLGYLFLLFPLGLAGEQAWQGGVYFAVSHGCAKAALFLGAATILKNVGHDRIAELNGAGQLLPATFLIMGLASVSLMGLPPSGTFIAKWLLLEAAIQQDQWWLAAIMLAGSLLAAGYLFRVLSRAFDAAPEAPRQAFPGLDGPALALAVVALLLGFAASPALQLLQIGSSWRGEVP